LEDEEEAFFGWRLDGVDKLSLRDGGALPTRLAVEMHSAWRALLAERGLGSFSGPALPLPSFPRLKPKGESVLPEAAH
jgi:hypothetical protein